ncbi:7-dehydrocholesterol reductase [Aplysia californica]|uniref:7-dehydrocholesterol reductase n=1 Tax=Aplysia californica TaxID=6500 RepID=A0ABM1ACQ1_APLCA|nr:7-dehydrocholesterol reductase [Aplysia californica]
METFVTSVRERGGDERVRGHYDAESHQKAPVTSLQAKTMVDTAEAEQLLRQGLGKRGNRQESPGDTAATTDSDMLSNGIHGYEQLTQSATLQWVKRLVTMTLVPIFLIMFVPNLVILIWYTVMHCEGSYMKMYSVFQGRSVLAGLRDIWSLVNYPSAPIVWILIGYCAYALAMMKLLPGKTVTGPLTPKGNTPVYKDNGFVFFVLTIVLFWALTLALRPFGLSPSILYDRFDEVLSLLNIFSLFFCAVLYLKGRFCPSSTDSGSSGNLIFDYYWGMELYPRVFGFDIKVFTNCRFGMMVWALLVCVHAVKSFELHGFVDSMFVSAFLQILYITKFFWWEAGYLRTIDIMLDRAGFYICWGCLVYIPGLYASVSYYLVEHPVNLGPFVTLLFLALGALSIYINFDADNQKQEVRYADGNCLIWGRKPDIIRAKYQLENGDVRESILLASGWWGLSRHFHYIPEIMLAFFWSVPALGDNIMPYSYVIWLVILLTHRSYRDDTKCGKKYGSFWNQYCKKVPHKIVPYLF